VGLRVKEEIRQRQQEEEEERTREQDRDRQRSDVLINEAEEKE